MKCSVGLYISNIYSFLCTKKITFTGKNKYIPKDLPKNNLEKIDKSNSNTTTKDPIIAEKKQDAVAYKEKKFTKVPSKVKKKKGLKYAAADNPENKYFK